MKVLFLTNLPSPYRVGFFAELGKLCDLTVIYERKSAKDRNKDWKNHIKRNYTEIFLKGKELGTDNSISFDILKYLNRDYDCIIVGMYSTYTAMIAISYMKFRKIPFIISTDGGFINNESILKKMLKTSIISSASAWLSTGEFASRYLSYYGAKQDKIYKYSFTSLKDSDILSRIPEKIEKNDIRKKWGMEGGIIIICVCQFIERKGLDILIKVASKIGERFKVYIIGGNNQKLESLLKTNIPSNVRTIDFLNKEELFEVYKASDIFVLPTREDVWGLVINEAMACGLPVITTTKCGAGIELINNDDNGFIVEVESVNELEKRIIELSNKNRDSIAINNINLIKKYTFENMAKEHFQIINEFLNQ